jgi:putative phage-type endonuclease
MKIYDFPQRSDEWYEVRRGVPTASSFDKIVTTGGLPSKSRQKFLYQLAAEKVSGLTDDKFQSQAMIQGVEREDTSRKFYELIRGVEVKEIGFCTTDDGKYGCSPDGIVGDNGLIEIKCPLGGTHVGYFMDQGECPLEYFAQVQGQLLVTGREWCDFISYYPGLKPVIVREEPNTQFQKLLKKELELFCEDLEKLVKQLI